MEGRRTPNYVMPRLGNKLCCSQRVMPWLHVKQKYFEIILKLFQCFISYVTTSETEIKLFQLLKEF